MRRILYAFLLIAVGCICFAFPGINSKIDDSLRQRLYNAVDDTSKVNVFVAIARDFLSVNNDSAFYYASKSRELAAKIGYLQGISASANTLGLIFFDLGNNSKAMEYFLLALRISEQIGNKPGMAKGYNNVGLILSKQNMLDKALDYYVRSLKTEEELGNQKGIAQSCNNIGLLFGEKGEFPQALKYSMRSLKIYEQLSDKPGLAKIYNNIGIIFRDRKDYAGALEYYSKSLDIEEELGNNYGIAQSAYNIAVIYQITGNINESNNLADRVLSLITIEKDPYLVSKTDIVKSENSEKTGDYKTALKYLQLSRTIDDSLSSAGLDQKIRDLESGYEIEKKQAQIDLLKKDKIIQQKLLGWRNLERNIMIGVFLLTAIFAFIMFRYGRRNKRINALLAYSNLEISWQKEELTSRNDQIIKQRDELGVANNAKDKFFSIIAHDLKSPFTGMLGFSEMLSEDYDLLTDEQRREFAVDIHSSIKMGLSLVENLLAWASIQTGKMEYKPVKIILGHEVDKVIELLRGIAVTKDISMQSDIDKALEVNADAHMLHSILLNLVSNALKFTKPDGAIRVSASIAPSHPEMIQVSVIDSGVGMSQQEISKLFASDIHFSKKGTANENGTGLGLLLCREMVEKHGGYISVNSTTGEGSTFLFTIPRHT
ncbi:MAG: tetratricopeptide repeat-containing sensor histidine kinase [Bacteroidales bacterium]